MRNDIAKMLTDGQHEDFSKLEEQFVKNNTPEITVDAVEQKQESRKNKSQKSKYAVLSGAELMVMDLPPVQFIVDGILPTGATILAAAPKTGKSWLALDLALCVANGHRFLGYETHACDVFYLCLEDSWNRIKDRINKIAPGECTDNIKLCIDAPRMGDEQDLFSFLDSQLKDYPNIKLIIIDTLQCVRGQTRARTEAQYSSDYKEVGAIKKYADDKKIAVLLVHHTRKSKDSSDPIESISGTLGISGAVDTSWVLTKQKRTENVGELFVTGRDVEMNTLSVCFNEDSCRWENRGNIESCRESRELTEYENNPLVKTIAYMVSNSPGNTWKATASEIKEALCLNFPGAVPSYVQPRELSKKIDVLNDKLLKYSNIEHKKAKNGNAGCKHIFSIVLQPEFEDINDYNNSDNPFLEDM